MGDGVIDGEGIMSGDGGEIEKVKRKRTRRFYMPEDKGEGIYNYLIAFTDDMPITTLVKRRKLYDMYTEYCTATGGVLASAHLFYGYMNYLKVDVIHKSDGFYYAMRSGITHGSAVAKGCFVRVYGEDV